MLMLRPLATWVTPPASEREMVDTPLTTVIFKAEEVAPLKFELSVGVKMAVRATEPREVGVQEQVAVVEAAAAAPHPARLTPAN